MAWIYSGQLLVIVLGISMNQSRIFSFSASHRLIIALFVTCLCLLTPSNSIASTAPSFQTTTFDGSAFEFKASSLNKPHLIVFWATWCLECRYEFHQLNALHQQYLEQLNIVGISIDQDQSKARLMQKQADLAYLNISDQDAAIAKLFKVKGTPTMYLVDQAGQIQHTGHRLNDELKNKITQLLK